MIIQFSLKKGEPSDKTRKDEKEKTSDVSSMSPLKGDEEQVKEGKGLNLNCKRTINLAPRIISTNKS